MLEIISAVASTFTAIGVVISAIQIHLFKTQERTKFEDEFAKEYRLLMSRVPTKALLGEQLSDDEYQAAFDEFYHYFDLCNEQIFLSKSGRISKSTWNFWKEGMISNFSRPAFARAWNEIAGRSNGDFSELREICKPGRFLQKNES